MDISMQFKRTRRRKMNSSQISFQNIKQLENFILRHSLRKGHRFVCIFKTLGTFLMHYCRSCLIKCFVKPFTELHLSNSSPTQPQTRFLHILGVFRNPKWIIVLHARLHFSVRKMDCLLLQFCVIGRRTQLLTSEWEQLTLQETQFLITSKHKS